jgi:hypothetical protein
MYLETLASYFFSEKRIFSKMISRTRTSSSFHVLEDFNGSVKRIFDILSCVVFLGFHFSFVGEVFFLQKSSSFQIHTLKSEIINFGFTIIYDLSL